VKFRRRPGKTYSPNGARECARRVRQAEAVAHRRMVRDLKAVVNGVLLDVITRGRPGMWSEER
jgi:hypothetical protein